MVTLQISSERAVKKGVGDRPELGGEKKQIREDSSSKAHIRGDRRSPYLDAELDWMGDQKMLIPKSSERTTSVRRKRGYGGTTYKKTGEVVPSLTAKGKGERRS